MADSRFFDNTGPFSLEAVCRAARVAVPESADPQARICDVAALDAAAENHLSFFVGGKNCQDFSFTGAGFCLVPDKPVKGNAPEGTVLIPCPSVQHAFAAAVHLFYPGANEAFAPSAAIDPTAKIGAGAKLGPGVVLGPGAEVGENSSIGANVVIGRGVAIGRGCEIGSNVTITHAYLGDGVVVLPGAQIGQKGYGFASTPEGHTMIPQIGRVIVQDKVEIGANTTIDRGALGDTVIGEGTKIDNLVQIAHNVHIGRHCIIVSQCGISGSSEMGDFVVLGGQVGVSDHCHVGSGARLAGRTALIIGQKLEAGHDYAGVPAKPLMDWIREVHAVTALLKKKKRE